MKTDQLKKQALDLIKTKEILFITDLIPFLGVGRATFYRLELHKDDDILEAIERNRVTTKLELRRDWIVSSNPTLQIALYKLLANEDELYRLTGGKETLKPKEDQEDHKIVFEFVGNEN